eukprot:3160820-Rhodomonas_salina.4
MRSGHAVQYFHLVLRYDMPSTDISCDVISRLPSDPRRRLNRLSAYAFTTACQVLTSRLLLQGPSGWVDAACKQVSDLPTRVLRDAQY